MPVVTIRYRDAQGYLQEIAVSGATARAIDSMRRQTRRESQRWRQRYRQFGVATVREADVPELGTASDSPRFRFTWLVGESRTWAGEPQITIEGETYCTICFGAKLPPYAYCLGCDRCGRELQIPGPGRGEEPRRVAVFRPRGRKFDLASRAGKT